MLVLARQLNERIIMPTVPATIEIVAIKPNAVRIGIDAPTTVTVLREEVLRRGGMEPRHLLDLSKEDAESRLNRIKNVLGNRLQTVALALDLIRGQMSHTEKSELPVLLQRMESEMRWLDRQLRSLLSEAEPPTDDVPSASPCAVVDADDALSI
ncbi:MAG TPA: carbon storage regulator [Gemmataceae bacterium]|nr:carbon storage regulator [Gemmataceae bacterium]